MSVYESIKRGLEQAIAYENGEATKVKSMRITLEKRIMDKRNFIQKLFGFCPQCGKYFRRVRITRQNTAYVDDTQNFFTGCRKCEEINDEYWADMCEEILCSL